MDYDMDCFLLLLLFTVINRPLSTILEGVDSFDENPLRSLF